MKSEEIITRVNELEKTNFVTAKFGNKWKQHAKEHYDLDDVIEIAHKQGRRALLFEKVIEEYFDKKYLTKTVIKTEANMEEPKNISIDESIHIFKKALSEIVNFDNQQEKTDFILDVASIYSKKLRAGFEVDNPEQSE